MAHTRTLSLSSLHKNNLYPNKSMYLLDDDWPARLWRHWCLGPPSAPFLLPRRAWRCINGVKRIVFGVNCRYDGRRNYGLIVCDDGDKFLRYANTEMRTWEARDKHHVAMSTKRVISRPLCLAISIPSSFPSTTGDELKTLGREKRGRSLFYGCCYPFPSLCWHWWMHA